MDHCNAWWWKCFGIADSFDAEELDSQDTRAFSTTMNAPSVWTHVSGICNDDFTIIFYNTEFILVWFCLRNTGTKPPDQVQAPDYWKRFHVGATDKEIKQQKQETLLWIKNTVNKFANCDASASDKWKLFYVKNNLKLSESWNTDSVYRWLDQQVPDINYLTYGKAAKALNSSIQHWYWHCNSICFYLVLKTLDHCIHVPDIWLAKVQACSWCSLWQRLWRGHTIWCQRRWTRYFAAEQVVWNLSGLTDWYCDCFSRCMLSCNLHLFTLSILITRALELAMYFDDDCTQPVFHLNLVKLVTG